MGRRHTLTHAVRFVVLSSSLIGCYATHQTVEGAAVPDAGPPVVCVETPTLDAGTITSETVDLLIVMDNSNSMNEEQASIVRELPNLVRSLSSGDIDFDGVEDFTPVGSLQLGVITTDMGTGGFTVPTCANPEFGDDGVLFTRGRTDIRGCSPTYPPFVTFEPGAGVEPEEFATQAGCVIAAGTGGCGFEQQLEAMLKAVTPSSSPVRFFGTTFGHGDGANIGFVRPDSVLVVLLVTDENDCSAADPELFNPSSPIYGATDLNVRCRMHDDALHPIERYADGLLALRRTDPGRLVYATISGIPTHLGSMPEETILASPELEERLDPAMPTRLRPSCDTPGTGTAFPPRRLLRVGAAVRRFGGRTIHQSICQDDYSPAVRLILTEVGRAVRPRCE